MRAEVATAWHAGCPVPLAGLRLLTVDYWGFDGAVHSGQLVVNADAAPKLAKVFRRLFELRFPIHHMASTNGYGSDRRPTATSAPRSPAGRPCRRRASAERGTGHWSEHAYGEAVDLNPVENPYVGCGMTRDKLALSYLDRSRVRRGMVTPAVVQAFAGGGVGVGRLVDGVDEGLHALLSDRPLARAAGRC